MELFVNREFIRFFMNQCLEERGANEFPLWGGAGGGEKLKPVTSSYGEKDLEAKARALQSSPCSPSPSCHSGRSGFPGFLNLQSKDSTERSG